MMKKVGIILMSFWYYSVAFAGTTSDTTEMIKTFSKVMSFVTEPYVYFKNTSIMGSTPIVQAIDTSTLVGEFYKFENDLYYTNGQETFYLQDSFYLTVNHEAKTVLLSKVNISTKANMNVLPLSSKDMRKLFQQKFIIEKQNLSKGNEQLKFTTKERAGNTVNTEMQVLLQYDNATKLPTSINTEVRLKQYLLEVQVAAIQQDIDTKKMLQKEGDDYFLGRTQTVKVSFQNINLTKEMAGKMPNWKEVLHFDNSQQTFKLNEKYKDYELTITF
jgi:hypothetical protein